VTGYSMIRASPGLQSGVIRYVSDRDRHHPFSRAIPPRVACSRSRICSWIAGSRPLVLNTR
jgi:hypothetical protein